MKYCLWLAMSICALQSTILNSQVQSGNIKYAETIHFEHNNRPGFQGQETPEPFEAFKVLSFTEAESSYSKDETIVEEENDELDGRRSRFRRMREQNNVVYTNIEENYRLEKQEAFGKEFIIKEELELVPWKIIAREQRDILGYTCMKAEYSPDTSKLITAWFTPEIPLPYGPALHGGLPGVILAVSDGTNRILLATEVELDPSTIPSIQKPNDKKTMTRTEFNTMRDEKIEEMRAMWRRPNRN